MDLYEYDNFVREKFSIVCGVDEAGRGPLAGDVYAAAVVFENGVVIEEINDSKKLSPKKRDELFDIIKEKAKSYCIATASIEEIEKLNILGASMLAMKRAIEGLDINPNIVLVDGNKTPDIDCRVVAIVKGDATSQSIAAASILAKVARDRYMVELDEKYPKYNFANHKGYGTKLHYEMVAEYGLCPAHRQSFFKNGKHKVKDDNT